MLRRSSSTGLRQAGEVQLWHYLGVLGIDFSQATMFCALLKSSVSRTNEITHILDVM